MCHEIMDFTPHILPFTIHLIYHYYWKEFRHKNILYFINPNVSTKLVESQNALHKSKNQKSLLLDGINLKN